MEQVTSVPPEPSVHAKEHDSIKRSPENSAEAEPLQPEKPAEPKAPTRANFARPVAWIEARGAEWGRTPVGSDAEVRGAAGRVNRMVILEGESPGHWGWPGWGCSGRWYLARRGGAAARRGIRPDRTLGPHYPVGRGRLLIFPTKDGADLLWPGGRTQGGELIRLRPTYCDGGIGFAKSLVPYRCGWR